MRRQNEIEEEEAEGEEELNAEIIGPGYVLRPIPKGSRDCHAVCKPGNVVVQSTFPHRPRRLHQRRARC